MKLNYQIEVCQAVFGSSDLVESEDLFPGFELIVRTPAGSLITARLVSRPWLVLGALFASGESRDTGSVLLIKLSYS